MNKNLDRYTHGNLETYNFKEPTGNDARKGILLWEFHPAHVLMGS